MFAPRFFPGTMFAPRFFPTGNSGAGTLADSLPEAIIDAFEAATGLDFIDGGITYGKAPSTDIPPDYYVAFWMISERDWKTTGPGYARRTIYQFDFYGPTLVDCEAMATAFDLVFNQDMTALLFAGGKTIVAYRVTGADDHDEYPREDGGVYRRKHIDVAFKANRSFDPDI